MNNRTPDLNLLFVFQALMSELNATRAALKLGVSQAAVSASLRRLRLLYGDPLFERTQRGLRPTARATVLQPAIEEALWTIAGTLQGSGTLRGQHSSVVRIGLSDDFEMAFGATIVALTRSRMPTTRIAFRQTNSIVAAQALNDREVDLAITSGGLGDGRLKHRSIGSSNYLIVYDPASRGSSQPFSLEEFVARDHILISYSGLTGITDDVLAEHGLRRRILTSSSHFSGLAFLLRGTTAIATIPAHAALALCIAAPFAVSEPPVAFPHYAFGVSWRFDTVRKPEVMGVRDLIAEALQHNPLPAGDR
jgi:DNA-binding transcriptional LysR family regulator